MNHILMPDGTSFASDSRLYGINAMEILINEIGKQGGVKARLKAKLFGGASMIDGLGDVGKRNAEFALEFLRVEGISCEAQSLGGAQARRIQFWPSRGRARQKLLDRTVQLPEGKFAPRALPPIDIEIF